ncbi:SURF1 family protein [Thalassococcus sp. BH17M4-6]|uniref:SURF1 family protein n=1 Tax=Thalassococcus sp. BH17M4-6 TaxID=3413148 RepID=UPI003BE4E02E
MKRILAPLLFGLLGVGILLSLGIWQLQRLDWKRGILDQIETRIAGAPEPLPVMVSPTEQRYQPVVLDGMIGDEELRVLVSVKQVGAGYRIISPFDTGDRRVLLDRGFVPVADGDAPRSGGAAQVTGNLHWPDDRNASTPENDVEGNIWFARDIGAMAEVLQTEPLLVIAREVDPTDPGLRPLPVDTTGIPNDHLQYAITWFSLAAVWAVMTGALILRQRNKDKGPKA